ncbi:MAG: hypothetical protein QOF51_47 [Chloroflexota bacterium]|jgi:ligand-binding SRPBCC domain-containing protein|nr:hypothetical protein [Chloroflexota bacterium]
MTSIYLETPIAAPIERCFDLMRDVDVHRHPTAGTGARAIAGVTQGLLQAGDEVTWEATHLGVRHRLTVHITRCDRPTRFEDHMVRGAFHAMSHHHAFRLERGYTIMEDEFCYTLPFGALGRLVDSLFLRRYLQKLLQHRARGLKQLAEAEAADIVY